MMTSGELGVRSLIENGILKMTQAENTKQSHTKRQPARFWSKLNKINQNQAVVFSKLKTKPSSCESYHRLINELSSGRSRSRHRRCCRLSGLPTATTKPRHTIEHTRKQDRLHTIVSGSPSRVGPQTSSAPLKCSASSRRAPRQGLKVVRSRMVRLVRWPLVHLCLPLCLTTLILLAAAATTTTIDHQRESVLAAASDSPTAPTQAMQPNRAHPSRTSPVTSNTIADESDACRPLAPASELPATTIAALVARRDGPQLAPASDGQASDEQMRATKTQDFHQARAAGRTSTTPLEMDRRRRSLPWATTIQQQQKQQNQASSLLMPINELRVSGSKLEPPSRPSQDWSKQRPYFGANLQRNLSVELGKTAHLVCKVFELGDKTVSWLRPRENEILTAGKYTYVSDPRISAMNENGSTDWVLEIKDVGLNDSTSYECQVSTDPKLSQIFNLHVQAARARIKTGENNYYPVGANIEFACEILPPPSAVHHYNHLHQFGSPTRGQHGLSSNSANLPQQAEQQIYWYHNGNLLNYAKTLDDFGGSGQQAKQNFTIDWDSTNQSSRLRLANIQLGDSGNYTCKPTSAEPATVRLFVKKHRNGSTNRVHYSGGAYHVPNAKEAQRTRQHHDLSADFMESSSANSVVCLTANCLVASFLKACLLAIMLKCLVPNNVNSNAVKL